MCVHTCTMCFIIGTLMHYHFGHLRFVLWITRYTNVDSESSWRAMLFMLFFCLFFFCFSTMIYTRWLFSWVMWSTANLPIGLRYVTIIVNKCTLVIYSHIYVIVHSFEEYCPCFIKWCWNMSLKKICNPVFLSCLIVSTNIEKYRDPFCYFVTIGFDLFYLNNALL